jgi:iron complex transport system ATP-binding protein
MTRNKIKSPHSVLPAGARPGRKRRSRSDASDPVADCADVLNVSNLHVERNGTVILDNLSWRVRRGEHWVILGANGSGKTSLLSALTGYLMPTAGEISLLGETYGQFDWRELRKKIGLVSSSVRQMMADDEPALATVASGKYAMIDFWGRLTRREKAQARERLRQVECGHLAERPWRVLSQGERQRVLIGRALMAKPRVLILDEPCAGLDPAAREHFLQFLQRLGVKKQSPTLILVTHHVEEIMPVFSHLLVLQSGRVLAAGTKADGLNSKNLATAFGAQIQLQQTGGRFALRVRLKSRAMM